MKDIRGKKIKIGDCIAFMEMDVQETTNNEFDNDLTNGIVKTSLLNQRL